MTIDYDTYANKSPLQKAKILSKLTPENKAELMVTHWRRWLEANRHRLNGEQLRFLEEEIAYITPELYRHPRGRRGSVGETEPGNGGSRVSSLRF